MRRKQEEKRDKRGENKEMRRETKTEWRVDRQREGMKREEEEEID